MPAPGAKCHSKRGRKEAITHESVDGTDELLITLLGGDKLLIALLRGNGGSGIVEVVRLRWDSAINLDRGSVCTRRPGFRAVSTMHLFIRVASSTTGLAD
jgi:hypothetical protein